MSGRFKEGIKQGEIGILQRLMEKKFGPLSSVYVEKLESLSSIELLEFGERLLDARTLEEIFTIFTHAQAREDPRKLF